MIEGKIIRWLKEIGDKVEKDEAVAEIETDKVNMEVESFADGFLIAKTAEEGDIIPVTKVIGYIGDKGEKINTVNKQKTKKEAVSEVKNEVKKVKQKTLNLSLDKIAATPKAKTLAKQKGIKLSDITPSGYLGQIISKDVEGLGKVGATPLAKTIAKVNDIDLTSVNGTGFDGKVTKDDVLSMLGQNQLSKEDIVKPLSSIRKVIAKRMSQSHADIPPVTLNAKADVTLLSEMRSKINEQIDGKISFNDIIIKAVAVVLKEQPNINVSIDGDNIIYRGSINIGMAVALEDGLIVPVIKNADNISLSQISITAKELAEKAKEGKLKPDDYSGGTFTISNLGMLGISSFTPIINQPESAILGVCEIEQKLIMDDSDKIQKRLMMGLSLTHDHRTIDGAQAALFIKRIKELMENPYELIFKHSSTISGE